LAVRREAPEQQREASDEPAEQPQVPDAMVQPRAAQVASDVAQPAARREGPEQRLAVQAVSGARLVEPRAARQQGAQLPEARAVAQQQAAVPSEHPSARLPQQAGRPARAGSAHRMTMRRMLSSRSASHRTQSSPAGRDEVLS